MNKTIRTLGLMTATALVAALVYRRYRQQRVLKQTKLVGNDTIDEWKYVVVDGAKHALLVRGNDKRNPVLLMVHGGPATPDATFARPFDNALVDNFVVIRYDQRGTGKTETGDVKISELLVNTYVNDMIGVAEKVKAMFPRQPLILVGHSWGSFLGLLAASRALELFDAYVGVGQVVNIRKSEPESYRYAMRQANREKNNGLLKKLKQLNPYNFYLDFDKLLKQRRVLFQVGGVIFDKRFAAVMSRNAFFSPDYSLLDLLRINMNFKKLGKQLYWQMVNFDFTELVPRLEIPVYFISGATDYQISPELARDYLERLDAPQKEFICIDKAGHFANFEQPELFANALVDIVKRLNLSRATTNRVEAHA